MIRSFIFIAAVIAATAISGCGAQGKQADSTTIEMPEARNELRAGSICTVEDGDGKFGVVKVLVINDNEAHVKIYKNKYDSRPAKVDLSTLSLGNINDPDGFGIGHVPLERAGFDKWNPVEIAFEKVSDDELEGYNMWKNQ
ncbi:MAG: hypothetical protein ACJ77K_18840 [Bacteroidia bacterium]